ncbi:MAG: hypothetical protein E7354_02480 [Clostridiales bacterium]|nr:hypothetical protein [Clostridiales bacterium]
MEKVEQKEKKTKAKKPQPEENILTSAVEKYAEIKGGKNTLYHISIVLLNIAVLVLMMLWINNKNEVVSFDIVKSILDAKIVILMCCIFVLIQMIRVVSLFISFHFKSKYNNFGKLYVANAVSDFHGKMSIYSKGKDIAFMGILNDTGIKKQHIVAITYEKKYYNLFAFLCLSAIMIIVGAFKWEEILHIGITLLCFGIIVAGFMYLIYIRMTRYDKERSLSICSFIAKIMAKLRLTSDFEKTYFGMVDKTSVVAKSNNITWQARILNAVSALSVLALRGLIIYLIFDSLKLSTTEYYFKSLWILIVLDLVTMVVPFPKGVVVVDLLLLSILTKMLYPQYIWWVLLMYKVFENLIYDIHYLIVIIVDKIVRSVVNKKHVNKENI